jgi:hypothetical protein
MGGSVCADAHTSSGARSQIESGQLFLPFRSHGPNPWKCLHFEERIYRAKNKLRENIRMIEFEANTLAFMTAALERCSKKLKNDTPEARKFIADKLKACARTGRFDQIALTEAGEEAVTELNDAVANRETTGWRALLQWVI